MNRKFIHDSNFVLKAILNKEKNLDILKDFIETILDITVNDIYLREQLNNQNIFETNMGISNVKVISDKNIELNIGIQIIDGIYIQNKMFLHYAQLYTNKIKTITINILDCEYFNTTNYHKIIRLKDLTFEEEYLKSSSITGEIHVIELPKICNTEIDTKEKVWVNYLKNGDLNKEILKKYDKINKLDNSLNDYWKMERL